MKHISTYHVVSSNIYISNIENNMKKLMYFKYVFPIINKYLKMIICKDGTAI